MRETKTSTSDKPLRDFNNEDEIRPFLSRLDVWKYLFAIQLGEMTPDMVGEKLGLTANSVDWLHGVAGESVKSLAAS